MFSDKDFLYVVLCIDISLLFKNLIFYYKRMINFCYKYYVYNVFNYLKGFYFVRSGLINIFFKGL